VTAEEIQAACLDAIDAFEAEPQGRFAWPLDALCAEPWQYWVQTSWVTAWNAEGRLTACCPFLRAWLTLANIESALDRRERFAAGEPTDLFF
jgi:hypothetical protein